MKFIRIVFLFIFFVGHSLNGVSQTWKAVSNEFQAWSFWGFGALLVDSSDNTLIAGGVFDSIGNIPAHNIAKWNGINWSPLGSNLPIHPKSIAIYNNQIYTCDQFSTDYKIYKWNGTTWNVFATPNYIVTSLKVHNGKLYAAGNFTAINGTFAKRIAVWDGTSWSEVGGGITSSAGFVQSMEFMDTVLYVSGAFTQVGGAVTVQNIAAWDGYNWHSLGSGLNGALGYANVLKEFNNELYAGGSFDSAGGFYCHIARWNGIAWDSVGSGLDLYSSNLIIFHSKLYSSGGVYSGINYVGRVPNWDGVQWSMTGDGVINASRPFAVYNNELYSGISGFNIFQGDTVKAIARFAQINLESLNSDCGNICNGTATVLDSVGVSPHTYLWSDGQTTKTAVGLCPGVYDVSVTDGGGSITEATVTVGGPSPIILNPVLINASCASCGDGSINVSVSGGTPLYTYQWNGGSINASITNLGFGNYFLTVTDSVGCSVTDTFHVSYTNTIQSQSTEIKCYGSCTGTATVTSNGIAPFTYLWNNNETISTINNLCADTFTVIVTDSNSVAATDTVIVTELPQINYTDTTINATCQICNNGSATIIATGGTPPFSYSWSNGATTQTADSLTNGTYYVTITDDNGCEKIDSVTIDFDSGINSFTTHNSPFTIYPNPANETITIKSENIKSIQLTNSLEQEIIKQNYLNSENQVELNIENLPQGIYFLHLHTKNTLLTCKFIKQ